jgi:hypothetical protein
MVFSRDMRIAVYAGDTGSLTIQETHSSETRSCIVRALHSNQALNLFHAKTGKRTGRSSRELRMDRTDTTSTIRLPCCPANGLKTVRCGTIP